MDTTIYEAVGQRMSADDYLREPWARYWDYVPRISEEELVPTVLDRFDAPGNEFEISYKGETLTRQRVDSAVRAFASRLRAGGLVRGDRLAVMLQNQPEFVISVLAAWRLGLVVVPVNPMYRRVELEHILSDSGVRAAVVLDELVEHVDRAREGLPLELIVQVGGRPGGTEGTLRFEDAIAEDPGEACVEDERRVTSADAAFLCYTSGTTGPAKGALLSHRNVMMGTVIFERIQQLGPEDVNFAIAPLFHVTGLIAGVTVACSVGMRLVLDYRFDAVSAVDLLRRESVTFTVGPTTVFRAMLRSENFSRSAFAHASKIICGGAPIPKAFSDEFREATGQRLHSGYGMTETASPCFGTPRTVPSPVQEGIGLLALGIPAPGTQCRLVDDDGRSVSIGEPGELVIRGPQVMSGYWRNDAETARAHDDGWLRTGDIAVMNDDGWFFMVDRKKNQINASGFKVWPNEVEDVLRLHPAVDDAVVVGVPDEYRGETVTAVIVRAAGAIVEEADIRLFCREHLAAYKAPAVIRFVESLPKSEAGKVLRNDLVAL